MMGGCLFGDALCLVVLPSCPLVSFVFKDFYVV
jgi:hypothetical protein